MAFHVIDEARRCLKCKKPLCRMNGCPVQTNVPRMTQLFLDGKINEAGKMLFENNPLSVVCSLVCDHEAQCEGNCVLGRKGASIQISSIEHYISDMYLDRMKIEREPLTEQTVAIVGAGPAGITVAIKLALKGYEVTVFESKSYIGGMMRYGIPSFRLPLSILDRYKTRLEEMGVHIRPNAVIGGTLTIDTLLEDGYDAIFIGSGVWRPHGLGVRGESLGNCHYAIHYLQKPEVYKLGDRVAIIGAGNSAMDASRVAIRSGASFVTIYARSPRIRAAQLEVQYAQADGVQIVTCKGVDSITKEGPLLYDRTFDDEGNLIGEDKEHPKLYPADSTIIAVSQDAKDRIVRTTTGVNVTKRGLIEADEDGRTTREGIFSAGDVVHGADNIVNTVRESKRAAVAIDDYLRKKRGAPPREDA